MVFPIMQWIPFLPWYPMFGGLLIFLAVLVGIWFIIHVEKAAQISWPKFILSIALIAFLAGMGFHLIAVALGA